MARVTRPGGRVALCAFLPQEWGPAWDAALEPMRAALARHGLPWRDMNKSQQALEALFAAAGLRIDRWTVSGQERVAFPSVELAIGMLRQSRMVPLTVRGVPAADQEGLQEAVETRFRETVAALGPEAADASTPMISIAATKPG